LKRRSPSASTLCAPEFAAPLGDGLVVVDGANSRLLLWRAWPTVNGQAADLVLGQADFTTKLGAQASAAATAWSFGSLDSVLALGRSLLISDCARRRFVGWREPPTTNAQRFDFVIPFDVGGCWQGRSTDGRRTAAADRLGNRVFVWDGLEALASGGRPTLIIGQGDTTRTDMNAGGLGPWSLASPTSTFVTGRTLYVTDQRNARVLRYTLP
jgi:hypothetical protein